MTAGNQQRRAILAMVMCASLWSIAGIFIKMIPWNPLVIAGFRSLIAAVVIVIYMRVAKLKIIFNRDSLLGGVFVAAMFLSFVSANKLTTAANAIVLQYTAPIFILIISAFFMRQRFHLPDIITVVITLLGISLFFFDKLSAGNLVGNCVGILAGLFLACMMLIIGNADDQSRMSGILIGHLITALVGVPLAFVLDTPVSSKIVLSILALGIVQLGIPYVLYGLAAKHCPPLMCSLIGVIEALLNPVWVFLFDGEAPGAFALVGAVVVIATITVWCIYRDRNVAKAAAQSLKGA